MSFSSSSRYSARTYHPSVSENPGSRPRSSRDTPHLTSVLARNFTDEFLRSLPLRSWFGKKLTDFVLSQGQNVDRTRKLVADLWQGMTALELLVSRERYELAHLRSKMIESYYDIWWERMRELCSTVVEHFCTQSPAVLNNPKVKGDGTVRLALTYSLIGGCYLNSWIDLTKELGEAVLSFQGILDKSLDI